MDNDEDGDFDDEDNNDNNDDDDDDDDNDDDDDDDDDDEDGDYEQEYTWCSMATWASLRRRGSVGKTVEEDSLDSSVFFYATAFLACKLQIVNCTTESAKKCSTTK